MSGGMFDSLGSFAEHILHTATHFSEHLVHELAHEAGLGFGAMGALRSGGGSGGGGQANPREILKEAAAIVEAEIKSGVSGSNPFGLAALSPETVRKKGDNRFLVETGAFAASVRTSIGNNEARVGSNDEKVAFLEMGTSKMPPRPTFATAGARAEPRVHAMVQAMVAAALK